MLKVQKGEALLAQEATEIRVPGKKLVSVLKKVALERFGARAKTVLNSWGITCWPDFADVVARMQKTGFPLFVWFKSRRENFRGRGSFDEIFPER